MPTPDKAAHGHGSTGDGMRPGCRLIPCVGAVVHNDEGGLLLVRRAHDPAAGRWSVPGGRVEPHETATAAVRREVREETGLDVRPVRLLGRVLRDAAPDARYVIDDYLCALAPDSPTPVAGDDAADVGWFSRADMRLLPLVAELWSTLESWQALPRN